VLSPETLSQNLKVDFVLPHVGTFLDHHASFGIHIDPLALQPDSLVDAIGPDEAKAGHDALASGFVLKEAFVGAIMADISDHVVEDDYNQPKLISEFLELLWMLVQEGRPLDVVHLVVCFDEIVAHRVDVVNHH